MATEAPPPYTVRSQGTQYQSIARDDEAQLFAPDREGYKFDATVDQCDADVRAMFVRKVYAVLFLQLLGTAATGALMSTPTAMNWVQNKYAASAHTVRGSSLYR